MLSGFSNEAYERQSRKAREALHKSKMKLLDGIAEHVKDVKTGHLPSDNMRVKAVSEMTPKQKLFLLGRLEEKRSYWGQYPAPIEQSMVEQACREFEKGNYTSKAIYEYLTTEDINQALSL